MGLAESIIEGSSASFGLVWTPNCNPFAPVDSGAVICVADGVDHPFDHCLSWIWLDRRLYLSLFSLITYSPAFVCKIFSVSKVLIPILPKTQFVSNRRYFQEYFVADFELKFSSMKISIALLSTAGDFQSVLYLLHFFASVAHNSQSIEASNTNLVPTNRSSVLSFIQCLVRCHMNTRMIAVVIRKLT